VVAAGTPAQLKERVGGHRLDVVLTDERALEEAVRLLGDTASTVDPAARTLRVATDGSAAQVRDLLDRMDPARAAVERFTTHTATLDDVFLALTGSAAAGRTTSTSTRETAHV
jgi:ABC-2 type transport system ATP-binding protein